MHPIKHRKQEFISIYKHATQKIFKASLTLTHTEACTYEVKTQKQR